MRLTEKDYCGYDIKNRNNFNGYDNEEDSQKLFSCLQKLGQLEDIEEELGVNLVVREKALQNGAWYKSHSRGIVFCPFVRIVGKGKALELKEAQRTATLCAKTCDYGKTWALTKEELL